MLDHARKFLSLVLPWPESGQGFCNIHWATPGQNGKKFWDGRACSDIDEAIKTIEWALKGEDPKDLYVCMSSQARAEEKVSKRGYAYKKAVRSQADVVALRSLFIDIDVKDSGGYPDTKEALRALKEFIDAVGIPTPSAVVASGSGGFHVHWALDAPLTRDDWQILANALAKAAIEHELKCDTQCTVDAARILRIPQTFNHKGDVPREVKLLSAGQRVSLDEMRAALGSYIEMKKGPAIPIPANADLGAGVQAKARPIKIQEVAGSCGFVKRTLETGGADNAQPLWFLTASLASFVEEGREALHMMSNGHPTYDGQRTDELYDRVLKTKQERDIGWPKCEKIATYGCKECASCPLLKQAKSPLNFALPHANDVPDGVLPEGFFRNKDGYIFKRVIDETGAVLAVQVTNYPMWDAWLSNSPWTLHFTTRTDNGPRAKLEIPTEVITAKDALAKYLGSKGIFVSEKGAKILKEFLLSWIQKLQLTKDAVISSAPFGWSVVDGNIEGFSFGGRVWMGSQDRPAVNPDPNLSYQYTPKGDVQPWVAMARIITDQKRPALDTIIAASFAAPLVRFTNHQGLMVNAYSSESGIGKTTAMKIAQAVWGDPIRAMQGLDDTANSVLRKVGDIRNLPLLWDELKTDAQTNKFVSMVFTLTGGKEKSRLNADSTLKASGTWQTMLVSASNDSVLDGMIRVNKSTTAGIYRTFEYTVPPAGNSGDHVTINQLLGKLNDNFGHPGLTYAKFLGANHTRIEKEVADLGHLLWHEFNFNNEERYWHGTIVALLKAAEYANELGLTMIDVVTLKGFLVTVLGKMREEINGTTTDINKDIAVSTILSQFLAAMRARHTLVTNRIWVSKGKPAAGAIKILNDGSKLDHIKVQIGKEDDLVRISSTAFSDWMAERGYSRHAFTKRMKEEFGMKDAMPGILGGGTSMASETKEYLLEINLADLKLKGLA